MASSSRRSRAAEECGAAHAAAVLQLHGEAIGLAEAADGAGHQREHLRVAQPAECAGRPLDDRIGGILLALALAQSTKLMNPWPVFCPLAPPPPPPPATVNRVSIFLASC